MSIDRPQTLREATRWVAARQDSYNNRLTGTARVKYSEFTTKNTNQEEQS